MNPIRFAVARSTSALRLFGAGLAVFGMMASAPTAEASFIGDTVGCNITGGGSFTCSNPTAVVVEPGIEFFVGGGNFLSVDIAASTVTIDFLIAGSLGATIINLTDMDWFGFPAVTITGATLTSFSNVNGLEQADVTFGAHNVTIDLIGTDFTESGTALITLSTSNVSDVPEPSTSALFGLGLVFGIFFLRKKNSQAPSRT